MMDHQKTKTEIVRENYCYRCKHLYTNNYNFRKHVETVVYTVESQTVDRATIAKITFFTKGHSK